MKFFKFCSNKKRKYLYFQAGKINDSNSSFVLINHSIASNFLLESIKRWLHPNKNNTKWLEKGSVSQLIPNRNQNIAVYIPFLIIGCSPINIPMTDHVNLLYDLSPTGMITCSYDISIRKFLIYFGSCFYEEHAWQIFGGPGIFRDANNWLVIHSTRNSQLNRLIWWNINGLQEDDVCFDLMGIEKFIQM